MKVWKFKKIAIWDKIQNNLIVKFSLSMSLIVLLFIVSVYTGLMISNRKLIETEMLNRARTHFANILLTRRWNAIYGGVYVEKVEGIESNPYLKNPDIITEEGIVYTKKNPALMTREISELVQDYSDYKFHITSLNPINPNNGPNEFESKSLHLFEEGIKETYENVVIEDNVYFQYMGPLVTEESCLQCHQEQGYTLGDIRGGISVTFRIDDLEKSIDYNRNVIIVLSICSSLLLLGIFYILVFRLNRNLNNALIQIKNLAERDSLTGLYNRRYLYEWANRELDRSIRYKDPISIIMLDVDFFKKINDQYGHKSGDITLKKLSGILIECSRTSDLTARYGGEEFLIILTNTEIEGASSFAMKLLEKIRSTEIQLSNHNKVHITASIGISYRDFIEKNQIADLDLLIDEADIAMYKAKEQGRNRIEIYRK